jgi:hypothetical protein
MASYPRAPLGGSGRLCTSAGLRTYGQAVLCAADPTGRRFPARWGQCLVTTVVPDYRCGAVPESHRVPSFTLALQQEYRRSGTQNSEVLAACQALAVAVAVAGGLSERAIAASFRRPDRR